MRYLMLIADPVVVDRYQIDSFDRFYQRLVSAAAAIQVETSDIQIFLQVRIKLDENHQRWVSWCIKHATEAQQAGVKILLNGTSIRAMSYGYDGVHWSEACRPVSIDTDSLEWRTAAVHSWESADHAEALRVNAVVFAPIFSPRSKNLYSSKEPVDGLERLRVLCARLTCPVLALGGIGSAQVRLCLDAGAAGVASLGGLVIAQDLSLEILRLVEALQGGRKLIFES
ncbi:MAG: thiamine phosphate synthase [Myxococcales bacterium]|nr:thiamine phosphate synthase [Myxococcales bacterium]